MRARLRVLLPLVTMLVAWCVQSTWSFTTEQASAGRAAYEQNCATCHGANLRQLPDALLAGREFAAKWGSRGTNELVAQMRSTMPPGNAGGLPEETYLAIAAYVLQVNGGGADGQALTARTATRISEATAGGGAPASAAGARDRAHRSDRRGYRAGLRAGHRRHRCASRIRPTGS